MFTVALKFDTCAWRFDILPLKLKAVFTAKQCLYVIFVTFFGDFCCFVFAENALKYDYLLTLLIMDITQQNVLKGQQTKSQKENILFVLWFHLYLCNFLQPIFLLTMKKNVLRL